MYFGAHMSTSGGVYRALERGFGIQCQVVQFFLKNNMQWMGKPYPPKDIELFGARRTEFRFKAIFAHSSYLINLGAEPSPNRQKSLQSLLQEVQLADSVGVPFIVMHPGAHLGKGEDEGIRQIVAGLDEVFSATRDSEVKIALENTAGQGTCLGDRASHLAEIFQRCKYPHRLGICLDTAHLFESGHDIRTEKGWNTTLEQLDRSIGLDQVLAWHLNDSKTELGSRVDRHAGIGQGKIGKEAFRHIVNDPRFKHLPGCLETPKSEDLHEDVENLAILRSLLEEPPASARKKMPARKLKAG